MSYFDISNGCDTCGTLMNDVPANQIMSMDNGSNMVAQMAMNNNMNNSMNSIPSMMNNNVSYGSTPVVQQSPQVVASNIVVPNVGNNNNSIGGAMQVQAAQQQQRKIVTANNTPIVAPSPITPTAQKRSGLVNAYNLIMLGLVIISALSWNETVKYHINQAVKFNDGNPMYYVAYAAITVLVSAAVYNYLSK